VFYPAPKSILIMGLGGGSIPMMFHNICKQTHIDVVEIAKKYFHFNASPGLQFHIDDASLFVKKSNKQYDLIIMDAYIGNELPRSLTTPEFFNEINRLLSLNGTFIANVLGKSRREFQKLLKKNGFENKEIWLLPGIRSRNTVVFASRGSHISKKELLSQTDRVQKDFPFDFQLINLTRRLKRPLDFFSLISH
ncbi:MAG: spermidine synthase, partial [Promethearchaeota archaeon]